MNQFGNGMYEGGLGMELPSILLSKSDINTWLTNNLIEKKWLWPLSYNIPKFGQYNRLSFYNIDPFRFSINYHPDDTISTFSVVLDTGITEISQGDGIEKLFEEFVGRQNPKMKQYISYDTLSGNDRATMNKLWNAWWSITSKWATFDTTNQVDSSPHKTHLVINLGMKHLKKYQYFPTLSDFLYLYSQFTVEHSNYLKKKNLYQFSWKEIAFTLDDRLRFIGNENTEQRN